MSTFRVKLQNSAQGLLDKHPTTGAQLTTSYQRQVYVMGPNKINRLMVDGETFTDCNYWKKFAYPQVTYEQAFIQVVSDDGSVYSDDESANVFPYAVSRTLVAGTTYTATNNTVDILTLTGGYAVFCQITNQDATDDVTVRLNGSATAIFTLEHASSQVFNVGDLSLSLVEFANSASGNGDVDVEVLCSIRSVCTS